MISCNSWVEGLSLLESGLLYALPFATGAFLAGIGGVTCDGLCKRIGARWGCCTFGRSKHGKLGRRWTQRFADYLP